MTKIIIPDYMQDFSCIGSDCEDTCCAGWKVIVDKKTYQKYRKVKNPIMRKTLTDVVKRDRKSLSDGSYAKIILDENGLCPLTDTEGLCTVHKELGESYLCNTCATYPRIFSNVDGTIEKTLTLSCPEAARVVLNRPEGIGFLESEEVIKGIVSNWISLDEKPYFWDLRIFIVQLLQDRQQTIEIRLIVLGLFLQKIESIPLKDYKERLPIVMEDYIGRLSNEEFINSLKSLQSNRKFQLQALNTLLSERIEQGIGNKKYFDLLTEVVKGLSIDKGVEYYNSIYNKYYEPFMSQNEHFLENYCVNYIFKNLFPYDQNTFKESFMMLIIHIMLIKLHLTGLGAFKQELAQEDVIRCIYLIGRTVEHNANFLEFVRNGMIEGEYTSMGHMFSLLK